MRGMRRLAHARNWLLALAALAAAASAGQAQSSSNSAAMLFDPAVTPAGCSSCGGSVAADALSCTTCVGCGCDGPRCVPGRMECCEPCEASSMFGRLMCGIKGSFCCPDPCYEPCYIPAANSAFFTESAKPMTQTRLRWDSGIGGDTLDRAEYFLARWAPGKGPPANRFRATNINWHELTMTTEIAVNRFSFFTEQPYRSVSLLGAGFGDLTLGTKSLAVDSEILLVSFMFKTMIPTASFRKGLGTGHVTLEPSLLWTLKVMPNTYLQGQLSQAIPIGGTPGFDGGVLHYHLSLNHALIKPSNDLQLIGSMEFAGYNFQDGGYTSTTAPNPNVTLQAKDQAYFALGPGFRVFWCQKIDLGVGMLFSVTNLNLADQQFRTEFRWRF